MASDRPPDAFLSYTRFDDQHDGGAISEFRKRLASAVRAVTGERFEIFQDVEGIGIGEHWPGKLDQMLDQTRFFIPVLTPSYFTSKACREELEKFLRAEAERGRNDLVLPIYYIDCDLLEEDGLRAADALASAVHERQRRNWRELRFKKFEDEDVRRELERLAREIARARRRAMPDGSRVLTPAFTTKSGPEATPQEPADQMADEVQALLTRSRRTVARLDAGLARLWGDRPPIETKDLPWTMGFPPSARRHADRTPHVAPGHVVGTALRDVDAAWCPEMVVIPPGEFMMGAPESERRWAIEQRALPEWVEAEKPPHLVRIAYPLAVGCFPVMFEEYGHFAQKTGREQPADESWGEGRRPVVNVSWDDAKAYVAWLSAQTGQAYRLLSEAEWEHACRAGTTTRFSWGDKIRPRNANYDRGHIGRTSEVGSYHANPWGLHDMHGNVWEWVEDCSNDSYTDAPDDGSAWISGNCGRRVARGGSWDSHPGYLRSASRVSWVSGNRYNVIGFRIARPLTRDESVVP